MIYTGIGARDTPDTIVGSMKALAKYLAAQGHVLRSGGAAGADEAFEQGCDFNQGTKEIYLPFKGFRKNMSELFGTTKEARLLAKEFHPNWSVLGATARDFMGGNSYQVLGQDLKTPTDFIVCWTKGGKIIGGTGQALRMADHYQIPVINLGSDSLEEAQEKILEIIL